MSCYSASALVDTIQKKSKKFSFLKEGSQSYTFISLKTNSNIRDIYMSMVLLKLQLLAWYKIAFKKEFSSYQCFNEKPVHVRANFKLLKFINCAAAIDDNLTYVHPYQRQSQVRAQ